MAMDLNKVMLTGRLGVDPVRRSAVQDATLQVLRAWGLQAELPRFLNSADGLAIAAHLCNAAAKFIDYEFYEFKPLLVKAAAEAHTFAWERDGIVYIETCVGQVSFHVFEDEADHLSWRPTPWAGGWMQDAAYLMAQAFLRDEVPAFERWIKEIQPCHTSGAKEEWGC